MVVISGIIRTIRIGLTVSRILYKAGVKTRAGKQWLSRHPRAVKAGTVAAGAGGLLLDLTSIDYSGILPKKPYKPSKTGQARNYMVQSRTGRQQYNNDYTSKRCPSRRQGRFY